MQILCLFNWNGHRAEEDGHEAGNQRASDAGWLTDWRVQNRHRGSIPHKPTVCSFFADCCCLDAKSRKQCKSHGWINKWLEKFSRIYDWIYTLVVGMLPVDGAVCALLSDQYTTGACLRYAICPQLLTWRGQASVMGTNTKPGGMPRMFTRIKY